MTTESVGPLLNSVMRKITAHAYGEHPLRVCRICMIKAVVTPETVSKWLVEGIPACQRCAQPTEILRTDQSHTVADYRAVIQSAQSKSQDSIPDTTRQEPT